MNAFTPVGSLPFNSPDGPVSSRFVGGEMDRLFAALDQVTKAENPRTSRLLACGLRKKSQKVVEEAAEVALEAVRKRIRPTVQESADLLYHLVVLWHECGIQPDQVWAEMRERSGRCGIAEKLPKPVSRASTAS